MVSTLKTWFIMNDQGLTFYKDNSDLALSRQQPTPKSQIHRAIIYISVQIPFTHV